MTRSLLLPENAVEVLRGESKSLQLTVTQPDPTTKTAPFDLTASKMYFTVKLRPEDREAIIAKTSADSTQIEFTNARAGIAVIYLYPSDTLNLDPTDYLFDVWVVTQAGKRFPVIRQTILRVARGITVLV